MQYLSNQSIFYFRYNLYVGYSSALWRSLTTRYGYQTPANSQMVNGNTLDRINNLRTVNDQGLFYYFYGDDDGNYGMSVIEAQFVSSGLLYIFYVSKLRLNFLTFQSCHNAPNGEARCTPNMITSMQGDNGLGGGSQARQTVTCTDGYEYLGKVCVKYRGAGVTAKYADAVSDCDQDLLYAPTDQDQNTIFREAMTDRVNISYNFSSFFYYNSYF